jgi:hypothetical protein
MWEQNYYPVAGSLGYSALAALVGVLVVLQAYVFPGVVP